MSSPALPDLNDANVRASVIAHAIRLGKCPDPGMEVVFSVQMKETDSLEDPLRNATAVGPKHELRFTVTAEDLQGARNLINAQAITYREPQTSIMKLRPPE